MHLPTAPDADSPGASHDAACAARPTRYGLPADVFEHAWTIDDIRRYLRIGRTQAYALAQDPSFPPRLRTGRSHRWSGLQVMAWLHHEDWRTGTAATSARDALPATRPTAVPSVHAKAAAASSPQPVRRRVPAAGTSGTPARQQGVVRRVVDPQRVHEARKRIRLAELAGSPSTPRDRSPSPAGETP